MAKFQVDQIVILNKNLKRFCWGGESEMLRIGLNINIDTIKAKVTHLLSDGRLEVKWLGNASQIDTFQMHEKEFHADDNIAHSDFPVGTWVYYLGAEAGGYETSSWQKGVVGQITRTTHDTYRFEKCGPMILGGSNYKQGFRLATQEEIDDQLRRHEPEKLKQKDFPVGTWVYFMGKEAGGQETPSWQKGVVGKITRTTHDAYYFKKCGSIGSSSNYKTGFRLATNAEIEDQIRRNEPETFRIIGGRSSTIISEQYTSSPGIQSDYSTKFYTRSKEINPETNLSFTPKPMVTNNIVNSREIETLLILE